MQVTINGEKRTFAAVDTLEALLAELDVPGDTRGIAVALNDAVVPRPLWANVKLADGDRIEIIQAVQGG